jgi:hypothetical protein
VTASDPAQLAERAKPCNGNAGDGRGETRAATRTPRSLCLDREMRPRIPAQPIYRAGEAALFGWRHLTGAAGLPGTDPGQAAMHRRSTVPGGA